MDNLASENRLLRHITQNIDCLEQKSPDLNAKTLRLHGQIDQTAYRRANPPSSKIFPDPPEFSAAAPYLSLRAITFLYHSVIPNTSCGYSNYIFFFQNFHFLFRLSLTSLAAHPAASYQPKSSYS
ncbi:hypothetical protein DID88_005150 [Monilinia fructigena]|uniref:Uncharacterized protein n=1 Tax=Monilinia fructigena TaxID=38457 RepID=A0A395IDK1_9HELO|nr:hypothetical protein DID88_005150 [Monilinia fructigena]